MVTCLRVIAACENVLLIQLNWFSLYFMVELDLNKNKIIKWEAFNGLSLLFSVVDDEVLFLLSVNCLDIS